jgi:hypothetical protein
MDEHTAIRYGARFPAGEGRERVRYFSDRGLTPREISKQLDISVQAVKYHLRKLAEETKAS